ncbi:hypothetical protein [Helicobacter pylori]|uniref:hypothetical protein n=1 Tax=Helicobacter pylori TaxID=210 RepID=UPI0009A44F73|nr:hypothetical protein [Helicobacter pylori]
MFGKSSNDTQENPKDAQKKEEEFKEVREENAKLNRDKNDLARERDKLADQNKTLTETNQKLTTEKERLERESKNLATDKENLTNQLNASQKQVNELKNSKQVLQNEKAELLGENQKLADKNKVLTTEKENLTKDKENLTTALSTAKTQAEQTSQKLNELEQRHAPYQKLEKLYEVFLEVKDRLNFNFVATTHNAMDLIASVLSDSKYYLESLYNKARQELSDKRSDKGEKLAELFDLLFEYVKDNKFERLKEPSAYDYSCKVLYPEQNASGKIQRVVLIGYKHNDKVYHTIVDMGS